MKNKLVPLNDLEMNMIMSAIELQIKKEEEENKKYKKPIFDMKNDYWELYKKIFKAKAENF